MNDNISKIKEELIAAGAAENEVEELAYFSKNLSNGLGFKRSAVVKNKFLHKVENINQAPSSNLFVLHRSLFASVLGVVLLLGFATIVSAQDSLPGQPLYPIKRITENVVSTVNPSFNSEIIKRRSIEIKDLSKTKNKTIDTNQNVKNTINAYEHELEDHRDINSKVIEQSKINLEEASLSATGGAKREIEDVLRRTEQRQEEDVKGASIEDKANDQNQNRNGEGSTDR